MTLTEETVKSYIEWAWEHLQLGEVPDRKSFMQECVHRIEVEGNQVSIQYTFTPPGEVEAK